jgi:S-DNA-T family DNA segregation ATPase FtsK/SpoIIIE
MRPKESSKKLKDNPTRGSSHNSDNESRPDSWLGVKSFGTRAERFLWDFIGISFLALALMTLLALVLPQLSGGLLDWWVGVMRLWFGWGVAWFVIVFFVSGLWVLLHRGADDRPPVKWGPIFGLEVIAFTSLALLAVLNGFSLARAEMGDDGGRVGWGLAKIVSIALQSVGASSDYWVILFLILVLLMSVLWGLGLSRLSKSWLHKAAKQPESVIDAPRPAVIEAPLGDQEKQPDKVRSTRKKRTVLPPQFKKSFRIQSKDKGSPSAPPPRDDRLPALDLMVKERSIHPDERNINLTAGLIEKTLAEFGIPAKVIGFRVGPTVTQFAVEPGYVEKDKPGTEGEGERQKVRVAQISSLRKDLALALSAERLRIEAPVPGQRYVGIEVPNSRSSVVRLRPILESEAFYQYNSPLTIALGRDVSGLPVVADLGSMPHLLIAGTTGSGKSVSIAALTTCLVMNNTPEDLRLVMIDPKMVELVRFNGLAHLYGKVETELERILGVLRWTVKEMERRYQLLEDSRSRNIDTYNRKMRRRKGGEPLPRIVVMIDELADLMMSSPDQTEHNLVRLAQMARATGIHLVLATQRPSTDVVTGLIKANFPARISFAVASSVDSRVILDTSGAESLLGQGDMLFLSPEASAPIRAQGVMVSDQEVERVITFWQKAIPPAEESVLPPWEDMLEQEGKYSDRDKLLEKAAGIVRQTQRASASMLQRRLRVGYPRAARLIDELEELGIVGPAVGGGREREVFVDNEVDNET